MQRGKPRWQRDVEVEECPREDVKDGGEDLGGVGVERAGEWSEDGE